MPFFWQINIRKNYTSKNNKPSLRDESSALFILYKKIFFCSYLKKRVSSFISFSYVKAGMTLEAALIMPIFLFAMINVISIMDIMRIKSCVDMAVAESGNEIAIECYGEYLNDIVSPIYIKAKVNQFLKENLSDRDYQKIKGTISVTNISILDGDNKLSFRVKYQIKPMVDMAGLITVKMDSDYYGHSWLGYTGHEETEQMVFLSNTASVYHVDKQCKYLNVTIMKVPYMNLEAYRNNSRKKYKQCNFCNMGEMEYYVYITPEGDGYHTTKNCIGLTRSIYTVPISQIKGKRQCVGCK